MKAVLSPNTHAHGGAPAVRANFRACAAYTASGRPARLLRVELGQALADAHHVDRAVLARPLQQAVHQQDSRLRIP